MNLFDIRFELVLFYIALFATIFKKSRLHLIIGRYYYLKVAQNFKTFKKYLINFYSKKNDFKQL